MKGIPSLGMYMGDRQIPEISKDQKQAEDLFKKLLLEEMVKQMYRTTRLDGRDPSLEEEYYQEQFVRTLTDKVLEAGIFNANKKED